MSMVDDKGLTPTGWGTPNAQVCLQSDEKGFLDLLLDGFTGNWTVFSVMAMAGMYYEFTGNPASIMLNGARCHMQLH